MIEKVFILHHTHVDLGYTAPRDKVCSDLVAMVDEVIELVDKYRDNPPDSQFRWIHEVSWPVIEYLRRGGKNKDKLFSQIREGLVELTALYVNPSALFDYDSFTYSIDYAYNLAKENNLPLEVGMFCDCPGIGWCLPDILSRRGIRYLSTAPNFMMSQPIEVERPFYWEGPEGGRVLAWFSDWRNEWYAEGLHLKLHEDHKVGMSNLMNYIHKLEAEGYRWKGLAIHFAMDNRGPEPKLIDFVSYFNTHQDKYIVKLSTNREFFEFMEKEHSEEFKTYRLSWPDWWANELASACFESSCSRKAKFILKRIEALSERFNIPVDRDKYSGIREDVLMFDEHTWGRSTWFCPIWSAVARMEWAKKRLYALQGLVNAREMEKGILVRLTHTNDKIIIANPHKSSWEGIVSLPMESKRTTPILIEQDTNKNFIGQKDRTDTVYFLSIPPESICRYNIAKKRRTVRTPFDNMENDFYRIDFCNRTGQIKSIYDKTIKRQITDENANWSFAEIIHECIPKGGRKSLYDVSFGTTNPESKRPVPEFKRKGGHQTRRKVKLIKGHIFNAIVTRGKLPYVEFEREIRIYHPAKRIDIILTLHKQINAEYESLYLALPFKIDNPTIWVEDAGSIFRAGEDQLPGSCHDWLTVGKFLAITNSKDYSYLVIPHDVPLIQINDINTGKWNTRLKIKNGHIYSWVMNNMWFTNSPLYQEGTVKLLWTLTTYPEPFNPEKFSTYADKLLMGISANQLSEDIDIGVYTGWYE